jgi:hypothetical protein
MFTRIIMFGASFLLAGAVGSSASPSKPFPIACDQATHICRTSTKEVHADRPFDESRLRLVYGAPPGVTFGEARGVEVEGGNVFHVHAFRTSATTIECEWYAKATGWNHDNGLAKGYCEVTYAGFAFPKPPPKISKPTPCVPGRMYLSMGCDGAYWDQHGFHQAP